MSNATAVKTADFEKEVLQSEVPVLVDFWAPWCPPCRAISPTLDVVASEFEGKAKIVKVDVDDEPEVAARYGVSSIPALRFKTNKKDLTPELRSDPLLRKERVAACCRVRSSFV